MVRNGQPVNEAINNAANMSRLVDTSTVGTVTVNNVTNSSDPGTGAIKTTGGLGVAKSASVGENFSVFGTTELFSTLDVSGLTTVADINANTVNASLVNSPAISSSNITTTNATISTLNTSNITNSGVLNSSSATVTNDLTVGGNLTINGTTTTLNSVTLDVKDTNITVNKTGSNLSSEGAGLTIDRVGTKGSIIYANAAASKFKVGNLGSEIEITDLSSTQSLTNKTLTSPVILSPTGLTKADVGLNNVDNTSDATKNTAIATLTNKTLTSPVINSPTGITKADVGLSNVDNTSDATKNAAAVTLTNKTLTAPVISSIVNTGTLTLPTTTDTLVGRTTTDTLVNKTLSAPIISTISNTGTITLPISTTTLVGTNTADTLTNKSLDANTNTISNLANTNISTTAAISLSKIAPVTLGKALQSNITTGIIEPSAVSNTELSYLSGVTSSIQTQIASKQDSSTAVTLTGTQTLTNKTLTSPVINTPTGITKSDVGLSNVDNTSDATKNAAAVTLTNKTITAPIISTIVNTGTLTLPTSTDTLVGKATTDTFTNKSISGSTNTITNVSLTTGVTGTLPISNGGTGFTTANTAFNALSPNTTKGDLTVNNGTTNVRLPVGTNGFALVADSTVSEGVKWASAGTGTGSGAVNFVTNPDAESGVTGWTVDSFAAASRPSGALTGISTGLTFTQSATAPLAGTYSFLLSKDAVNRQGRVVYTGITITPAYFAKVLSISADYLVKSGTFVAGSSGVDSDVIFYLQDVTSGTFIEPSSFKLLSNSTTISDKFQATFQTSAASTSYRLLIYVASTSASAYSLQFDNISVSPSNYVYGTPITDWQTYTSTITGTTTSPTKGTIVREKARWRRVGDSMEVIYQYYQSTAGSAGSGLYLFSLPSGYSIDLNKFDVVADANQSSNLGTASAYASSSASAYNGWVYAYNSTSLNISVGNDLNAINPVGSTFLALSGASATLYNFMAKFPIQGWSSSVQMSDSASTRVVAARALFANTSIPSQSTEGAAEPVIQFVSKTFDNTGSLTITTGSRFTAPVQGTYKINGALIEFSAGGAFAVIGKLYKNGSSYNTRLFRDSSPTVDRSYAFSDSIELNVGDYVDIRVFQNSGSALTFNGGSFSIERISGPSAIAASESVTASYKTSAGASFANGTEATVLFATKIDDSHGIYNTSTGNVSIQTNGIYIIEAQIQWSAGTLNTQRFVGFRDGSNNILRFEQSYPHSSGLQFISRAFWQGRLTAGQTIAVRAAQVSGGALTLSSDADYNQFSIRKVGN